MLFPQIIPQEEFGWSQVWRSFLFSIICLVNFVTERFAIKRGVQYCRNQLLLLKPYSLRADYIRFRSDSVSIYLKKFGPNSLFLDLKMVFHGYCCFFPSKSIFLCLEIYPGSKKINLMRTLKLLAFFVHTYSPQCPPFTFAFNSST